MKSSPLIQIAAAAFLSLSLFVTNICALDTQQLVNARNELAMLLRTHDEAHPDVKAIRARIGVWEAEIASALGATSLVSVDFPGGTVAELVAALSKDGKGDFNLIGEKANLAAELPPFSVRNAEPASFADALTSFLHPRGFYLDASSNRNRHQGTVYTVRRRSDRQEFRVRFESFQLGRYLGQYSIDDIVGAIRAGWELNTNNRADDLKLKFHPSTGILLVSAPEDGILVAKNVLDQLGRAAPKVSGKSNVEAETSTKK